MQRAKEHVDEARTRHRVDAATQDRLLDSFATAVREGDTAQLATLLTADVELRADGGGKATAARAPLLGRDAVLAFVTGVLHVHWGTFAWERRVLNGGLGFVLRQQGQAVATVAFALDDGGVRSIFIMRNPDKLARLEPPA